MNILCKIGIHKWIREYKFGKDGYGRWRRVSECVCTRCEKEKTKIR